MALTDLQIKKAQPKEKAYKMLDGLGLYLQVTKTGGKWWRFKYQFEGKEKLLSLGVYPDISLAEARNRLQEARTAVAIGIDPSSSRKVVKEQKAERAANSCEAIAREWHKPHEDNKAWSAEHAATIMTRLEKDVFPLDRRKAHRRGHRQEIKAILDRVRSRGVIETARRVRTILGQIYTYAIATDRANYDISAGFMGYLPPTSKTRKHMASVTDPKELAPLLRAMDAYQGSLVAQSALKLLPMLFVRPGELRHMEWAEIDLETAEWNIPGRR